MKKLLITTALVLTISSNANAYDRFMKFRQQAQPSVEVNYGALQYLQPDFGTISADVRPEEIIKRPAKPYRAPVAVKPAPVALEKITVAKPIAKIAEIPEFAPKVVNMPKPVPQITQPNQVPSLEKPKTFPVIAPEIKTPAPEKFIAPLEAPKLSLPPVKAEIPAMPKQIEPLKTIIKPAPENLPLEMPKLAPVKTELPTAQSINPVLPEIVEKPALKELPKLQIAPAAAPKTTEVVLPPLFPSDTSKAPAAPASSKNLPPLKPLFTDNSDKIEIPKLPNTDTIAADTLPSIPAPNIADVQVNNNMPKATEIAQLPPQNGAIEASFTFTFNETETELPLSEQARLGEVAQTLKSDKNTAVTINAYASGTAEQSSQAKRTSLARALSVRRFMLEKQVPSEQIIIRPNGNESGNGVPDRIDIKVGKKVGA